MVSKQAGRSSRWMPPRSNNNKGNNKTSYPYVRRALESVGRKEGGSVRVMHSDNTPVRPSARVNWFAEKKEAKNKKQTKSEQDRDRQVKEWGGVGVWGRSERLRGSSCRQSNLLSKIII